MSNRPTSILSPATLLMLGCLGLLWGGSFFFASIAVRHVPPFTLAFLRFLFAALALHIVIAGRHAIYREIAVRWRDFLLLGLMNNAVPHSLIFLGQTEIGAGLASILNATTPIWTVAVAHVFTRDEKLSGTKLLGCTIGLAGTAALFSKHLTAAGHTPLWAMALPLAAALSYGFAAVWSRRFSTVAPPVTAAGQLTASTLIMLPVVLLHDRPWHLPMPPASAIAAILMLALLSTALAYILYFRLIAMAGATTASLVTLIVPPSAILLSTLFLGERMSAEGWLGLLLILIGLVVLDGRTVDRISLTLGSRFGAGSRHRNLPPDGTEGRSAGHKP
jgi:drug/metabolite transporter (DMT)-like permease